MEDDDVETALAPHARHAHSVCANRAGVVAQRLPGRAITLIDETLRADPGGLLNGRLRPIEQESVEPQRSDTDPRARGLVRKLGSELALGRFGIFRDVRGHWVASTVPPPFMKRFRGLIEGIKALQRHAEDA